MTRRILVVATALVVLPQLAVGRAVPAHAVTGLQRVVDTITHSGGRYVAGGASLAGADCSGLVSVAQSLATGQKPRRFGSTHTLLAGQWPHAIRGASPDDLFVIGGNASHMVARVGGVNIEARQSGEGFRIGADARSPFDYPQVWHIDPKVLVA